MGVEVDGKTHGPATNMAQLGIERGAYRTGLLKGMNPDSKLGDFYLSTDPNMNDEQKAGDLRDGMAQYMMDHGQSHAENWSGNSFLAEGMWNILQEAVQDRENFLKKPPMTLGYGQLMKNLNGAVRDTVFNGDRSPQIGKIIESIRPQLDNKTRDDQTPEGIVVEFLHDILADSINAEMDPEVVHVGQLLRANNVVAMLSDDIITITNPLGHEVYIGAKQSSPQQHRAGLNVTLPGGGKTGDVTLYESVPSGSAIRDGKPGGWGRGRIIPAVIQGLDGAWMISAELRHQSLLPKITSSVALLGCWTRKLMTLEILTRTLLIRSMIPSSSELKVLMSQLRFMSEQRRRQLEI